jgi:hypothetical protein
MIEPILNTVINLIFATALGVATAKLLFPVIE